MRVQNEQTLVDLVYLIVEKGSLCDGDADADSGDDNEDVNWREGRSRGWRGVARPTCGVSVAPPARGPPLAAPTAEPVSVPAPLQSPARVASLAAGNTDFSALKHVSYNRFLQKSISRRILIIQCHVSSEKNHGLEFFEARVKH